MLRAQLSRLDAQIDHREERRVQLAELLAAIPGVTPQGRDRRSDRNPHYMMMFRVDGITEDRRNELVDQLVASGLPAFAAFRAIYRTDCFWERGAPDLTAAELARRCPVTEAINEDCLWLHHRVLLGTRDQIEQAAAVIAETVAGR